MRFTQIIVSAALVLLVFAFARAQTPPGRRHLDQAVAIEDPNERIVALKAFIATNSDEQLNFIAGEQIALSWAQLAERQLAENNIGPAIEGFRRALGELPGKMSDRFFEETVARIPFVISARGYRTEAIELARLLEGRFAKEPLRLGALGEFYMNLEAPGEAIRALEAATKLAPDEVRLRRPLAAAYRMSLRLGDAAKEFAQVAALDGSDLRAYGEMGNLARARGDYPEAIRLYRSQLRGDEKLLSAIKGLALSLLASGKEDEAKTELDRIRQLKGQPEIDNDLYLQTQMTFYYLAQGKTEQATDAAMRALAIEPRYSWTRIAAAEVDMAAGQPFEAEKHLLSALRNADFPTLRFTLGKLYLVVEDFDGALEQFNRVLTLTPAGKFKARLGGVLDVEAESINELLARERQAAIFVAAPPTSDEQFTMAEALLKFDARLRSLKGGPPATAASPRRGRTVRESPATIEVLATAFIEAEGGRRAFRALYAASRLAQTGQSLPFALKLSDQVLDLAEAATETEGSLREFPNYDREARLRTLRGRALDTKGWTLFQLKRNREAMTALAEAIDSYGGLPEAKTSIWRLAMMRETVGEEKEALVLYLAAYEPPTEPGSVDVKRTLIEVLYQKVHGSLDGLNEKLGVGPRTVAPSPVALAESKPKEARPEDVIAQLPDIADLEQPLAPGRATSVMKGMTSSSLVLVKVSAVKPSSIGKPIALVETKERDAPPLSMRRMNAGLLHWPSIDPSEPPPFPIVRPTLIELEQRDVPSLPLKRLNARLLRWPPLAEPERALTPSGITVATEIVIETPTPSAGTRPRTVTEGRPRVTSGATDSPTGASEGNTRLRRVEKPSQPER